MRAPTALSMRRPAQGGMTGPSLIHCRGGLAPARRPSTGGAPPPPRRRPTPPPPALLTLTLAEPAVSAAAHALFSAATVYTVCVYGVTLASQRAALKLHATRLPLTPLVALWAACVALIAASPPATAAVAASFQAGWVAATAPAGVATPGWLPAFAAAFAHPAVSAAAWAHLLTIDLVQARWILADGADRGVPVRHSVGLSFMAGPLGLVSHFLTRAVVGAVAAARRRGGGGGGSGRAANSSTA